MGNPFSYKEGTIAKYKVNSLEECLQKYKEWIVKQDDNERNPKIKGKTLGCWCKPKKDLKEEYYATDKSWQHWQKVSIEDIE